jgi:ribosome biogenesis GTPase
MNIVWNSTPSLGVICRRNLSAFLVLVEGKTISCRLSPRFGGMPGLQDQPKFQARQSGKPRMGTHTAPSLVVGDRVSVERVDSGTGRITEIYPRRNRISRRSTGGPGEQILAANIDQVLAFCAVGAAHPEWNQLDRFLALAEIEGVPAVIVLSKADRMQSSGTASSEIDREISDYQRMGYPVILCSVRTGLGISEMGSILPGKDSLLLGKSGVGKSSLLNALFPDWHLRVAETSRSGEGRCTTSNAELHPLRDGAVVDTPGIRRLALWDAGDRNQAYGFREMRPLVGLCRFGLDCRHTEEPGCAIRRAVETGRVSVRRFRSMLHLAEDRP